MENIIQNRRHNILMAVIREFITTAEPVGSATITVKYNISASPATIRNDMVKLEQEGYLFQPHTSSGRVPTDKAYRYYVNFILQQNMAVPDDVKGALDQCKHYEGQLQRLLEFTSKLLSEQTRYTSLILAPRLRRTMFKYLRLSPIDNSQILIIMLTNTGAVINKVIQLDMDLPAESLEKITNILNERLCGMFLADIDMKFLQEIEKDLRADFRRDILEEILAMTRENLDQYDDHFIYDGAAHLLNKPEFHNIDRLRMIIEMLEEETVVAEILKKTLFNEGVKVYIGHENPPDPMKECSIITAPYQIGNTPVGTIGIMGPTRMPYHRIIPVVNAFAKIFSDKITKMSQ